MGANVNDVEVGKRRTGNSVRQTPLIAASISGNLEVVKYLVKKVQTLIIGTSIFKQPLANLLY